MNDELRALLIAAPEGQMTETMRGWIANWSSPPTIDEITETRNRAAYTSECSDFVISVLNISIIQLQRVAE